MLSLVHNLTKTAVFYMIVSSFAATHAAAQGLTNPAGSDAPAAPAATSYTSLGELVEESGFAYRLTDNGHYRITVEWGGEVVVVEAYEHTFYEDENGRPVKCIFMYGWIMDVPEGFQPSIALLQKINEINGSLYMGRVQLNEYGMYYSCCFWLDGTTLDTFLDHVSLTQGDIDWYTEQLAPFVNEYQDDVAFETPEPAIDDEDLFK